ncbi:MAG: hypothetical protein HY866_15400 [Chloroflexi bacterium]|nr:hypothetical protein [Chloroflexota bacterium]
MLLIGGVENDRRVFGLGRIVGRRVWSGILIVVWLWAAALPLAPARAQDDLDAVRGVVQAWLLQQIGKPGLILVSYTYSGETWTDSSLGCPAPGQPITAEQVSGYRWTFLYDNQVRYEVHSGLTGTPAVLCGATNQAPDVRLITYNGTAFTILAPEAWLVFPSAGEVLFAPDPLAACDQPGMRVVMMGRVASGSTPDQLLDETIAAVGVQEIPSGRVAAGTFGRSTTYETSCDSETRAWRISTFIQYGDAFRVEQWSPAADFERWNVLFENMLTRFGPAGSVPAAETTGTDPGTEAAAEAAPPVLTPLPLAHLFAGDVFVATLADLPGRGVTTVPTFERRFLAYSPDGLQLSYLDTTNGEVRVLDVNTGVSPRKIAQGVDPRFPPAWSADSQKIAYVASTTQTDANGAALLEIYTVPLAGGEASRISGFAFGGNCAVETTDPADRAYYKEAGPAGEDPVFVWMPDNQFLVSMGCAGGLGMLNPATSEIADFGADLRGGVMSPDRTRFAARTDGGIALLDFTKWERINLRAGERAMQIAWGLDGSSLYYSTETPVEQFSFDDETLQKRGQEVFGIWPVSLSSYTLEIVRLDLASVKESVIWSGVGRAVGRITVASDASGLLFSLIPDSAPLAQVMRSQGDSFAVRAAWPEPVLYWLPAGSSSARLLAYSGQPVFAPVTLGGS